MAKSIEFYRKLCSSETVRSGKRGFFRDFSDSVTELAGERWTREVFGKLSSDEDRVRALFTDPRVKDAVVGALGRVTPLYRGKDAEVSRTKRLEGHRLATAGDREQALVCFSQAVLRAPQTGTCESVDRGLSLPLAHVARADVFASLGEHSRELEDLRTALAENLPQQMRLELEAKFAECEKKLELQSKSGVLATLGDRRQASIELAGGPSEDLPCASSKIEIQDTVSEGKRAVARARIHPGDTLVVEPPLAACLLPEFYGTHCQHCFARLRAPVGCQNCSSVAFCCTGCRDEAISTYHKYECKIVALLIGSGMSVLSSLALRMATQLGPERCRGIQAGLSGEHRKLSKSAKRRMRKKKLESAAEDRRPYELVTHSDLRSAEDFLERSLMAAFLLKCLRRVNFFPDPESVADNLSDSEAAIGALILRNLQLLQFNAHEVFETRRNGEHRFRGSRPVYVGVALYPTVARFNHDCYPAVTRYFVGKSIVISATRSLEPGDAVAENYGPIFTKRSLDERQRSLQGRYWFRCRCNACVHDWPLFDNLTNDTVKLRCPTTDCAVLHPRATDSMKLKTCPGCRLKIDLTDRRERLSRCESLYEIGFARLDEERPDEAAAVLTEALETFHEIASPPHRDTHLAEIALQSCMADRGNSWCPPSVNP